MQLNSQPLTSSQREIRFKRVQLEDTIYFKSLLCEDFSSSRYPLPDNIRKGRNYAIILAFLEVFCCLASFGFYARRRSRVTLAIVIMDCIFTVVGIFAKLNLSYWGLMIHAAYTISVIGGFYIYIIIENVARKMRDREKEDKAADTWVLIVTSLPMVALFCMGIYSLILVLKIDDELDARKEQDKQREENRQTEMQRVPSAPIQAAPSQDIERRNQINEEQTEEQKASELKRIALENQADNIVIKDLTEEVMVLEVLEIDEAAQQGNECVICLTNPKETIFYPCGHQSLCFECSEIFKQKAKHMVCPICRNRIKDIIKVFK